MVNLTKLEEIKDAHNPEHEKRNGCINPSTHFLLDYIVQEVLLIRRKRITHLQYGEPTKIGISTRCGVFKYAPTIRGSNRQKYNISKSYDEVDCGRCKRLMKQDKRRGE